MGAKRRLVILLVGELNPYSTDERYDLYDLPVGSAGWRLRSKIFGLRRTTYFQIKKKNLCRLRWDASEASKTAAEILLNHPETTLVLLGKKVLRAFDLGDISPFTVSGRFVVLPHPSGRCREWNDPAAITKTREIMSVVAPEISWGEVEVKV